LDQVGEPGLPERPFEAVSRRNLPRFASHLARFGPTTPKSDEPRFIRSDTPTCLEPASDPTSTGPAFMLPQLVCICTTVTISP
jgi:hypothetical protein